jgi:hypothetical protein
MNLKINCQGIKTPLGKLAGSVDLGLAINLSSIKPKEIAAIAGADARKISELLKNYPKELERSLAAFIKGDLKEANRILKDIKGSEDDFINEKGGVAGLIILLVVVVMLYSCPAK